MTARLRYVGLERQPLDITQINPVTSLMVNTSRNDQVCVFKNAILFQNHTCVPTRVKDLYPTLLSQCNKLMGQVPYVTFKHVHIISRGQACMQHPAACINRQNVMSVIQFHRNLARKPGENRFTKIPLLCNFYTVSSNWIELRNNKRTKLSKKLFESALLEFLMMSNIKWRMKVEHSTLEKILCVWYYGNKSIIWIQLNFTWCKLFGWSQVAVPINTLN